MVTPSNPEGGDDDVTLDPDDTIDRGPAETDAGGGRVRGVIAAVLGVLAILVLAITAVGVWAKRTVLDSDKVADIVGDALDQPEVEAALADYITTQVFTSVDVDAALQEVLPDQLQRFEPVLAAGARTAVERGLTRVLANPDVQALVEEVVKRAHARAVDLLEGDGLADGIDVTDGVVTLNTLPLIGRAFEQVQQLGVLTNVELPELTAEGDPTEQIAALEEATGRDLPDDFGQLVVYRSERLADAQATLANAQRLFALVQRAIAVLVVLSIVLVAATILVARRRWRATFLLALGGAAAMVIVRSAARRVVEDAPELAARPGGQAAIESIVSGASTGPPASRRDPVDRRRDSRGRGDVPAWLAPRRPRPRRGRRALRRCRRHRRRQPRVARRRDPRRGGRGDRRPADVRQRARPTGAEHGVTFGQGRRPPRSSVRRRRSSLDVGELVDGVDAVGDPPRQVGRPADQ